MHPEAFAFVARTATLHGPFGLVVEHGGRDINGSVRSLFPGAAYTAVDILPGPGVDVVADAQTWQPDSPVDAVVCCEVLEHVEEPGRFLEAAWKALRPGGRLIVTAACPPRAPHSALDGGTPGPGEWYRNIHERDLRLWLMPWSEVEIEVHGSRGDIYATGVKPWG